MHTYTRTHAHSCMLNHIHIHKCNHHPNTSVNPKASPLHVAAISLDLDLDRDSDSDSDDESISISSGSGGKVSDRGGGSKHRMTWEDFRQSLGPDSDDELSDGGSSEDASEEETETRPVNNRGNECGMHHVCACTAFDDHCGLR